MAPCGTFEVEGGRREGRGGRGKEGREGGKEGVKVGVYIHVERGEREKGGEGNEGMVEVSHLLMSRTLTEPGATSASPVIRFTVLCVWRLRYLLNTE